MNEYVSDEVQSKERQGRLLHAKKSLRSKLMPFISS